MSRKTPPRWIYATAVLAGAVFVATVVAFVATYAASSGGQYARESSGNGRENQGGGTDSSPSSSTTTNTIRMPTTVRPSPAPSVSMLEGDILDPLQTVSTTVPRTVPTTTAATPLPPPPSTTVATPTTAGSLPIATSAGPPATTTTLFPAPNTPATPAGAAPTTNTTNTTTTAAAPVLVGPAGLSNNPATTATWYGIGDIPYSPDQAEILSQQMRTLPSDAEFLIHVGDLRLSGTNLPCRLSEYQDAANRLALSHAPVFVVLGDNDWTDCPDRDQGLRMWKQTFVGFESKHWNHTFNIERQTNRTENFAFVHKGTLFMGLNLIGGLRHNKNEWEERLTEQAEWTIDLIQRYKRTTVRAGGANGPVGRIVIFGHANPHYLHNSYFNPLQNFIAQQLNNEIPIMYLNGDKHEWSYDTEFMGQPSFLRVMVSGKGVEPPIKVVIDSSTAHADPVAAFVVDRRL
jgi:hypothetical protein